jgi:hypothetical protein
MAIKSKTATELATQEMIGDSKEVVPLADIEANIDEKLKMQGEMKLDILKDLASIYEDRTIHFKAKENHEYIDHFADYVRDRFKQSRSTYYADTKVVKMLVETNMQEVLETKQDDLVEILRIISRSKEPKFLLDKIEDFDRKSAKEEVDSQTTPKTPVKANPSVFEPKTTIKGLSTTLDAVNGQLMVNISGENVEEKLKFIKDIIENLDDQAMLSVYRQYVGPVKEA